MCKQRSHPDHLQRRLQRNILSAGLWLRTAASDLATSLRILAQRLQSRLGGRISTSRASRRQGSGFCVMRRGVLDTLTSNIRDT
jgi:hypothetical protein